MEFKKTCYLVITIFSLLAILSFAQTNEEIYNGLQFNLFSPGAAAYAMGGAFIGYANNNSALFHNPAGLAFIDQPELSSEFKMSNWITLRSSESNTFSSGNLSESSSNVFSPSYISFIYPFGNIAFAISTSNIINYRDEFQLEARPIPDSEIVLNPTTGLINLDGYNIQLSIGLRISDYLSLGLSAGFIILDVETMNSIRSINPTDYFDTTTSVIEETILDDSSEAFSFSLGILLTPVKNLGIGVMFSHLAPVTYMQNHYIGGTKDTGFFYNAIEVTFDLPDRFGIGMSYKPIDRLAICIDYHSIIYSQMTDVTVSAFENTEKGISYGDNISNYFKNPNYEELHFGLEYQIISGDTPIYVRGGFFTIPNHRPYYIGTSIEDSYKWNIIDTSDQISETEFVVSGGLGIAISKKLVINGAYLMGDSINQGMISLTLKL